MAIITVVGAGQMGSSIVIPARENGHTIRLVGTPKDKEVIEGLRKNDYHINLKRTLPKGMEYYQFDEFLEALKDTDLLVGGVSSFGLDWFIDNVIPLIPEGLPVLSITKGMVNLKDGSLLSYPELYERSTDKKIPFMAVGGPCTSYELADHDPSEVTFCGRDLDLLRKVRSYFEAPYYHVSLSTDVRGVECAVALKNAYALGVSLAIGMSFKRENAEINHYNSQAAIFAQAIKEMTKLLHIAGGDPSNLALGAGDLYVTVYGGRTRKIGILLGEGLPFDKAMEELKGVTLESIVIATRTAEAVKQLIKDGKEKEEDFPLLMHINELLNEGKTVNVPFKRFETEFDKEKGSVTYLGK